MSQSIIGANPLAGLGVTAVTPANLWTFKRDPGPQDNRGYIIGDQWRNSTNQNLWWYASSYNKTLNTATATWILLSGGSGDINSIVNTDGNLAITTISNVATVNFSPSITVQRNIIGVNGVISMNNDGTSSEPTGVIGLNQTSNDIVGGHIQITKQHGTGNPIVSGDVVGNYSWYGFDGTNYVETARITSVSSGTVAPFRVAGDLEFWTHADASSSPNLTGTQRAVISSAGNITINAPDSGVALTSVSTYGQAVGATQSLVVVDNTGKFGTTTGVPVPAYSRGTWTPTLTFGGASVGMTYVTNVGKYTVIGNVVYFNCVLVLSALGSSTGTALIEGLPFATLSQYQYVVSDGGLVTLPAGATYLNALSTSASTNVQLFGVGTVTFTALDDTNFNNNSRILLTGFYFTS